MSTNDVPGYKAINNDKLARGCWAEHNDGSLIYVKDIDENDRVIFEMYDFKDKRSPVFYPLALPLKEFETTFSYDPNKVDKVHFKWTWHDKTPFPWDKVMKYIDSPVPQPVNVKDTFTAATRVAESLRNRMGVVVTKDHIYKEQGLTVRPSTERAAGIWERLKGAIGGLK